MAAGCGAAGTHDATTACTATPARRANHCGRGAARYGACGGHAMLTSGPSAKVVQLALGDDAETSVPPKPDHASVDTGGVTTANVSSAHRRYATEVTCII